MNDDLLACRLTVRGRVQGVFFRDSTRREARRHGVSGWAANRADGTVEVALEGRPADVRRVIDYCRHGPRGAEVKRVEVRETAPQGLCGFEIR